MTEADAIVARVFPRRTSATPIDDLVFIGPPGLFPPPVDAVHVSVAFAKDLPRAEWLARQWETTAPVSIGGPAMGGKGGDFIPGRYLKPGYVITSRGCPNQCWFCDVWKREGPVRELPITKGWNVLDDNLLACSEAHIRAVFAMLGKQSERVHFTGGLEAARLEGWHLDLLRALKPKQVFFAYDTPGDLDPLRAAGQMLLGSGFTRASHQLRCYVLIGYPKDTLTQAAHRMAEAMDAGFLPMAMLWHKNKDREWKRFQRHWARPAIAAKEYNPGNQEEQ